MEYSSTILRGVGTEYYVLFPKGGETLMGLLWVQQALLFVSSNLTMASILDVDGNDNYHLIGSVGYGSLGSVSDSSQIDSHLAW